MKLPSYFTTLKILLVIILSAVIFFIVRQYSLDVNNNKVLIEDTLHYQRTTGGMIIIILLVFMLFLIVLLHQRHDKEKSLHQLALAKAAARFEETLQSIDDPFFGLDSANNIIYFNEAFRVMTGQEASQLPGQNLYEVFRQFNSPSIHKNFLEVFETGKPLEFELYDYFYDNWKDVNIHPISAGVSVLMKDASLRKKYEAELKTAMQFLEETNTVGIIGGWELDIATGKVTWTNETCNIHEAPIGYSPDLKNAVSFYKAGYSRDAITHAVKDGIEKGTHWDKMLQIITLTGKEKWVRAIGRPETENGEVVKLLGSFQDVQQQKLMIDKLVETEQKFDAVFEHSTKAKLLLDIEEQIIDANRSLLDKIGYSKDDIMGKNLSLIKKTNTTDGIESDGETWKETCYWLNKNGDSIPVVIKGAIIKDKAGMICYYLLNIDF